RELLGPQTAFSTDVIVGFPGETEREFEETLETCRAARFMKVHVFPFSRRDGTPAATMPDQVSAQEIRRRVQVLSDLERELAERYYLERAADSARAVSLGLAEHAGDLQVLAERVSERGAGWLRGTDRWYMPVEFRGTVADLGTFVRCRATAADRNGVVAERLDPLRPELVQPAVSGVHSGVHDEGDAAADWSGGDECGASELPLVSLGMTGLTGAQEWRG
ncbi:MAG: hypothetical protein ACKON9_04100, partial [Planctomycetaceae bacterium]